MACTIRPMNAADKPALMALLRDTPEFKPHELCVAEEVIDAYLNNPTGSGYNTLVAIDAGTVSGYICYGPTPCTLGTWDMYWQAVARAKRGQGIGGTLAKAAESHIVQENGRLIIIETSSTPEYENTRRFHINRGYEIIATVPDFYAAGDNRVILQKRIRK